MEKQLFKTKKTFIFNFKINKEIEEKLKNIGVKTIYLSKVNKINNKLIDPREEIFLQKINKQHAVLLKKMQFQFLIILSNICMIKYENKNPFLSLTYKKEGKVLLDISFGMSEIIGHVFGLTFSNLLIYHNSDDSITVNASDILSKKEATCLPYFEEEDEKLIVRY